MHGAHACRRAMPILHRRRLASLRRTLALALARSRLKAPTDSARGTRLYVQSIQLAAPPWIRSLLLARSTENALYDSFGNAPFNRA